LEKIGNFFPKLSAQKQENKSERDSSINLILKLREKIGPMRKIKKSYNCTLKLEANGHKSAKSFQADLKIKLKTDFILTFRKTTISNTG
jgi:hypothetical protein